MNFNLVAIVVALAAAANGVAVSAPPATPSGNPQMRNCDTRYLYCGSDLMSISNIPNYPFVTNDPQAQELI